MTVRQKILKLFYPLLMKVEKKGAPGISVNEQQAAPPVSFYSLQSELNNGKRFDFSALKGKKVLLVNVASKCGFTPQYSALESLYEKYKDRGLVIVGIPANNYGAQEPGTNQEIKSFCTRTYHVSFPMM